MTNEEVILFVDEATRTAKEPRTEAALLHGIQVRFGAKPGLVIFRNTTGVADLFSANGGTRGKVSYGLGPGSSDLVCCYYGRWICAELKTPGKPVPNTAHVRRQRKWLDTMSQAGAVTGFVRSYDEFEALLHQALPTSIRTVR